MHFVSIESLLDLVGNFFVVAFVDANNVVIEGCFNIIRVRLAQIYVAVHQLFDSLLPQAVAEFVMQEPMCFICTRMMGDAK